MLAVQEGALYPALSRLNQKGWIKAEWARSELNKDVKVYRLTPDGQAELRRRTADWKSFTGAMTKVLRART